MMSYHKAIAVTALASIALISARGGITAARPNYSVNRRAEADEARVVASNLLDGSSPAVLTEHLIGALFGSSFQIDSARSGFSWSSRAGG
jgi:hypothetical protein